MPDTLSAAVRRTLGALARPEPEASDGQLIGRFLLDRDEDAFAALVHRHGPMVLSVCRRLVGDRHLAEDAFQAVFLVLARRAHAVAPPAAVGGWLYGVAHRTALSARSMRARNCARECLLPAVPDRGTSEAPVPDPAAEVLDQELARLPEKYRAAIVVCELEGRSRREAARLLGVPEGTLSSRLATARKLLAERLQARGFVVAVPALLAVARAETRGASPVIGRSLIESGRVLAGAVPAPVATLAHRTICAMYLAKLRFGVVALLAVAVAALVATGRAHPTTPVPAPLSVAPRTAAARPAPVPKPAPHEERLLVWIDDQTSFLKPDGTVIEKLKPLAAAGTTQAPMLSPDGGRLAWLARGKWDDKAGLWRATLNIRALDGSKVGAGFEGLVAHRYCWSADGRAVLVHGSEADETGEPKQPAANWSVDVQTGKRTPLGFAAGHVVIAADPDGKTVLTSVYQEVEGAIRYRVYQTPLGGGKPVPLLAEGEFAALAHFSPDGRRLLCWTWEFAGVKKMADGRLNPTERKNERYSVIELGTGKRSAVRDLPEGAILNRWAWSPDSKRIAYAWFRLPPPPEPGVAQKTNGAAPKFQFHIVVADADGGNAKEVHQVEGTELTGFDWR